MRGCLTARRGSSGGLSGGLSRSLSRRSRLLLLSITLLLLSNALPFCAQQLSLSEGVECAEDPELAVYVSWAFTGLGVILPTTCVLI